MIYNLGLYPYLSDTPKLDHLGIHGEWNNYKKINIIHTEKKTRAKPEKRIRPNVSRYF